jgi:arylsulfatase A-like enzyme
MYEESMKVPLLVYAPGMINGGKELDEIIQNIDIAPTILDAAGIPNTYGMDGISLKGLADNTIQKTYFFYQYAGEQGGATIRGVRSNQYKYVKHYCNNVTEEFYNLFTDPRGATFSARRRRRRISRS